MEQHPYYKQLRDGDLTAFTYQNGEIFVEHKSGATIRISSNHKDGMIITVQRDGLMTPWALNHVPAIKVFKPRW